MFLFELQVLLAVGLDLLCGDPRCFLHPVRIMGSFCNSSEKVLRQVISSELMAGFFAFTTVLSLTVGLTALLLFFINLCSHVLAQCAAIYLLYTCIAAKDLVVHSRLVYCALQEKNNLDDARSAVAQIVGRDTTTLDRKGIIRACIETVAENMVDGVTAPLFYALVSSLFASFVGADPLYFAILGGIGYKAINTMDSMFAYKNERYLYFGRVSAKVDDFVNFIPARMSGLFLVLAAFFLGLNWRNSYSVFKRDRLAHASPNAAHPEAAVAGALDIELGGPSLYFGKNVVKPRIGDDIRPVTDRDILHANYLTLLASLFCLIFLLISRFFLLEVLT